MNCIFIIFTANGGQQQPQPQQGQVSQQGQPQGGQHPSQLQGLLQQQILVPQNQLNPGGGPPGVAVSSQSQPMTSQPQGQPPITSQGPQYSVQPQQIRGPHPRMRAMIQQGQRGPMIQGGPGGPPGAPQQGGPQQQQMQIQQQRFRLQQFRGPMTTSGANGEPLRPHFPPQQPMQVMRMPIPGPGGHPIQMQPTSQGQGPSGGPPGVPGAPPGSIANQGPGGMMTPGGQPPQPHPMQSMQQMRPPPPAGMATGSLRLSIPPQQAMPPQPRTPGSTGSQQPSPALTPRSDMGDHMDQDSNSSRGTTPAPGEGPFDGPMSAGPGGPGSGDGFFPNGEPPQKVVKRRPSQQKRRQSQTGVAAANMMGPGGPPPPMGGPGGPVAPPGPGGPPGKDIGGPLGKKRARKGSRVEDNVSDYDSYLDSVMSQLKNLPPVATVEPRLHHFYNACPMVGCGEMPKTFGYDLDTKFGGLEGCYGNASLPNEGDYYNTMPFGPEPPVPNIKTVTITAKGFYNQEFEPKSHDKKNQQTTPPSCMDSPSPDLFYR